MGHHPHRNIAAVMAEVDIERLKRLLAEDGLSISEFLRGRIDEYLEDVGEPPLMEIGRPGVRGGYWKGKKRPHLWNGSRPDQCKPRGDSAAQIAGCTVTVTK
jgi:hypothetical protein